jgi:hypothetical protein
VPAFRRHPCCSSVRQGLHCSRIPTNVEPTAARGRGQGRPSRRRVTARLALDNREHGGLVRFVVGAVRHLSME